MTEDYAVQQKTSAVPYLIGGAAVGAVGGKYVDKIPGFNGITKAKYASFDDILKEKKDFFTKTDGMSDELKEAASKINGEREKVVNYVKENIGKGKWLDKVKTEGEAVDAASKAYTDARNAAIESIKAKKGEIESLKNVEDKDLEKAVRKYLKENIDKDEFKAVKDAKEAAKKAVEALKEKAKTEKIEGCLKPVEGLKAKKEEAWNAVKEQAGKFKTANKKWNMIACGAILALLAAAVRPKHKDA